MKNPLPGINPGSGFCKAFLFQYTLGVTEEKELKLQSNTCAKSAVFHFAQVAINS